MNQAATSLSAAEQRRQLRRAIIAATIGTTIEWYDFFLYGVVAGIVFNKLYFPAGNEYVSTMLGRVVS